MADFRQELARKVVNLIANGNAPWQSPFDGAAVLQPFNPVSNVVFRGGNALAMMLLERDDPRWCSDKQAAQYGWGFDQEQDSTTVEFWRFVEPRQHTDANGEIKIIDYVLDRPQVGYGHLYNGKQIKGIPAFSIDREARRAEGIALAQHILDHVPVKIVRTEEERFVYRSSQDEVHLPRAWAGGEEGDFHLRSLSMVAYATGHPKRLNRRPVGVGNAEENAKEELRVQLARVFLAQRLGLPFTPQQRNTYTDAWIKLIDNDPGELFSAARDAEQMTEYLMAYSRERVPGQVLESDVRNPTIITAPERELLRSIRYVDLKVKIEQGESTWKDVVMPLFAKGFILPDVVEGGFMLSGAGIRARQIAQTQEMPSIGPKKAGKDGQEVADGSAMQKGRIWLNVPFADKDEVKAIGGAHWDAVKKSWYVPEGGDAEKFKKWQGMPKEMLASDIRRQFANALADAGLVLPGDGEPIMDGQKHYVTVSTSRNRKAKKGAYVGHLEGVDIPQGFIWNYDQNLREPWRAEGVILSPEQRAQFQKQMEENRQLRDAEVAAEYEAASQLATRRWNKMREATAHPYLERKQVEAFGLRVEGKNLVTPVRDVDGKIWSLHLIEPQVGGAKLFLKNGAKAGHFHILGDLETAKYVGIGEGYATCGSVKMAMGPEVAMVEAFDCGNLDAVIGALKPRLKEGQSVFIAGDDDFLTSEKILSSINKQITSELATKRFGVQLPELDEVAMDGQGRAIPGVEHFLISLSFKNTEEGVPRVVGQVWHEETGTSLPLLVTNQGREKGMAASVKYDAPVVFPTFASLDGGPSDFNDLHVREGLDVVREQVGRVVLGQVREHASPTPEMIARRTLGEGAKVVPPKDGTSYVGQVLGNTDKHAVQGVGRQKAVAHELDKLDRVPEEGKRTRIAYQNGRGTVMEPKAKIRGGMAD